MDRRRAVRPMSQLLRERVVSAHTPPVPCRRWRIRLRCWWRGHPMGLSVTLVGGEHYEYCACGRPKVPAYVVGTDGRMWIRGREPR